MLINNPADARTFFKKNVTENIIGVGVAAFNRVGLEEFYDKYEIFSLKETSEDRIIRKNLKLHVLEELCPAEALKQKRNSTTVIKSKAFRDFANKKKNKVALLFYKSSLKIENICQKEGYLMLSNKKKFGKSWFENKIKFRKILRQCGIEPVPGFVKKLGEIDFESTEKKLGKFVIQLPKLSGGRGTFFIFSKEGLRKTLANNSQLKQANLEVVLSKFMEGSSPSITGCVLRKAILHSGLQLQILDNDLLRNPEVGSGVFCGHEWTNLYFSKNIKKQAETIVLKLGSYLRKAGYRGIFGIDFLLDKNSQKLYPLEINPRFLGSFPVMNMIQLQKGQVPLQVFHVLEFLLKDFEVNEKEYNKISWKQASGSQLVFHNTKMKPIKLKKALKSGIYRTDGTYLRQGYRLKDIRRSDEVVLADNMTKSGVKFDPHLRFFRLVLLRRVLQDDNKNLSPSTIKIISNFLDKLND